MQACDKGRSSDHQYPWRSIGWLNCCRGRERGVALGVEEGVVKLWAKLG